MHNQTNGNLKEALRWLKQAEKDLTAARNSLSSGDYEWSCFQSQQSAEKALKSILYAKGLRKILTHSVFELLREVSIYEKDFLELKQQSKILDSIYISARYPNGIAGSLTPSEYFEEENAKECISYAESILKKVMQLIEK
jgi:HEPN domain-containing protein